MAIISAKDARFKSLNGKRFYEIEEDIEKAILKAADKGWCTCDVSIDIDTSKEIREKIMTNLTSLGYTVTITDRAAEEIGWRSDQMSCYDEIFINWNE